MFQLPTANYTSRILQLRNDNKTRRSRIRAHNIPRSLSERLPTLHEYHSKLTTAQPWAKSEQNWEIVRLKSRRDNKLQCPVNK